MKNDRAAVERITSRFGFYRSSSDKLSSAVLVLALAVGALTLDHIYIAHHPPDDKYFFTDSHGQIVQATPMDAPVMSEADVLAWTVKSMLAAYNFDYVHYREQLSQNAQPNFTIAGWNGFVVSMREQNNLEQIKHDSTVVSSVATGAPVINRSEVVGGVLVYEIQFPAKISYLNAVSPRSVDVLFLVRVIRVPTRLNAEGLAIDSFQAKPEH